MSHSTEPWAERTDGESFRIDDADIIAQAPMPALAICRAILTIANRREA